MTLHISHPLPGVLAVRLDRPAVRNAIDLPLIEALLAAFEGISERVVVLASTDPSCFCAGADLHIPAPERARVSELLYELYRRMLCLEAPIIAAVGGHVVGGGAQLAIASDLRIGTPSTRFRLAGPGHGLAVGAWGLPSLVGRGRALDLCLTGRTVEASEALSIGLLDRIADDAIDDALGMAVSLAALDAGAVGRVKSLVRDAAGLPALLEQERLGNQGWSGEAGGLAGRPAWQTP